MSVVGFIGIVMTTSAHAIVADRFSCAVEIKDLVTKISTWQEREFYIARLPLLNNSPASDIKYTAGRKTEDIIIDTESTQYRINHNFYYSHAIKTNGVGVSIDARQHTCLTTAASYCPKNQGGVTEPCRDLGVMTCILPPDPFNENSGWLTVPILNGEPAFSQQSLGGESFSSISNNEGVELATVKSACRYLGTYQ